MSATRVLVVDDEPEVRAVVAELLGSRGFDPVDTGDPHTVVDLVRQARPSVVLLDVAMPGMSGLDVLPRLREAAPDVPVVMLTALHDVHTVVQAMRLGAYDYLSKPCDPSEICIAATRAAEHHQLLREVHSLRTALQDGVGLRDLMGPSPVVAALVRQVDQVAASNFTVLVQGETGAGKELVARSIHRQSPRRAAPFVAVDCGAIPDALVESELFGHEKGAFTGADQKKQGQFAAAHGGTLFLDEVGNLPAAAQAKVLRALQERQVRPVGSTRSVPVDARVIAAANLPLGDEVQHGRFRQDLYYRLSEFTITVPPLRERREDVLPLANRFLVETGMELKRSVRGFSEAAAARLGTYDWPGNVRELRNVVRRAVLVSADLVEVDAVLPPPPAAPAPAAANGHVTWTHGVSLRQVSDHAAEAAERQAIRQALEASSGNKSEAARLLRTDFKTLHTKMRHYGILAREFLQR
jgi:two-component system nitrogen regulation response regulator GlnG